MRILVAVDDDGLSKAIIDFVAGAFSQNGNIIKLLHAIEPSSVGNNITEIYGSGITREILEERLQIASGLLADLRNHLRSKISESVPVENTVLVGSANHVILDVADDWNSDVIVMGSHGRTGLSQLYLGSISMSVLSHADCPVTIIRLPQRVGSGHEETRGTVETMRKYR